MTAPSPTPTPAPAPSVHGAADAHDAVRAEKLTKLYGTTRALLDFDASFAPGEVSVVAGPNGSGKSTLLALLAQTARPTSGRIHYAPSLNHRSALRAAVGMVAHDAMLYPDLTGLENLELYAALYAVAGPQERVASLRERFGVGRFAERPVRTYSRGQVQRVALCRALLHAPRILLLDEPTNGLDTDSVARLADAIAVERTRGIVQILVTHDEAFAERVADTRIALRAGRRVDGPTDGGEAP
ncbi:MAG: ABC transporter ATP-binding protein [Myxococcales bacterium]|nr:ABC transporter ATP-binding protein [Myxococcales bacterium]MCB9630322.1 ABC transporter ATP-binding protein [Sandaracinaceae bacterium]